MMTNDLKMKRNICCRSIVSGYPVGNEARFIYMDVCICV